MADINFFYILFHDTISRQKNPNILVYWNINDVFVVYCH